MKNPERRTLSTKTERDQLLQAYDGRCGICHEPILDEDWEVDHIVPYSITGRTNIHEVQPAHKRCNRKKGTKIQANLTVEDIFSETELRQMRRFVREHAENMAAGNEKFYLCDVGTGCGKSDIPAVSLKICMAQGIATHLATYVPTDALKTQLAKDFLDPNVRNRIGHNFSISEASNNYNPARGTNGFVSTYYAVGVDGAGINAAELERRPYLLALDECHHVARNSAWHKALQPLVDAAERVVFLSGSLERGDQKPVAFLPYKEVQND